MPLQNDNRTRKDAKLFVLCRQRISCYVRRNDLVCYTQALFLSAAHIQFLKLRCICMCHFPVDFAISLLFLDDHVEWKHLCEMKQIFFFTVDKIYFYVGNDYCNLNLSNSPGWWLWLLYVPWRHCFPSLIYEHHLRYVLQYISVILWLYV